MIYAHVEQIKAVGTHEVRYEHRVEINGKVIRHAQIVNRTQYNAIPYIDKLVNESLRAAITHTVMKELYDRT